MDLLLALAPVVVAAVAFVAYCLVDLARRPRTALPKPVWALIILASVPLGGIAYLLIDRRLAPAGPGAEQPVDAEPDAAPIGSGPAPADRPAPSPPPGAEPADGTVLRTEGLTKRYGEVTALEAVDLTVPAGSVYGLVGPNGSGKTTLLGVVAGLRRADAGTLDLAVARREVGVLPDTPQFDPWLTAAEVCGLAHRLATGARASDAVVRRSLGEVGLAEAADRRCGGFSRGMLQRLGLASVLVSDPRLLLLDEPASALDPGGRKEILDLIAALRGRATVVVSSHILADVERVADRVGILREGRLLREAPLEELLVGQAAPTFTVRLRSDAERVARRLGAHAWVTRAEAVGGQRVEVGVDDVAHAEVALPAALAEMGAAVRELGTAAPDLEQVFLELTADPGGAA